MCIQRVGDGGNLTVAECEMDLGGQGEQVLSIPDAWQALYAQDMIVSVESTIYREARWHRGQELFRP